MNTLWEYATDEDLIEQIRLVLKEMEDAAEEVNIYRNVIDPFSAIFDMARLNIDFDEWQGLEQSRQAQKSLQNAVGYFHQHILGCVDDWVDTGTGGGVDIRSDPNKVIAEIKNKHNTMNSSSGAETYRKMANFLEHVDRGYTGYVVTVIPKNKQRFKKPYNPGTTAERQDLFIVDGSTFYEIVTGDKDALKKLYACLPKAIATAMTRRDMTIMSPDNIKKLTEIYERAF